MYLKGWIRTKHIAPVYLYCIRSFCPDDGNGHQADSPLRRVTEWELASTLAGSERSLRGQQDIPEVPQYQHPIQNITRIPEKVRHYRQSTVYRQTRDIHFWWCWVFNALLISGKWLHHQQTRSSIRE